MAKARKIVLETRTFEKAGDATAFFSEMLNRYSIGEAVSETDSADLNALLIRHDELQEKVGNGIRSFEVNTPPDNFAGRCFWIVRNDLSRIDFSIGHCLQRKPNDEDFR